MDITLDQLLQNEDALKLLLQDHRNEVLLTAVRIVDERIFPRLYSIDPSISEFKSERGSNLLFYACMYNNHVALQQLMALIPDINYRNIENETALTVAVAFNSIDCVRLLLMHPNIMLDIASKTDLTPLLMAINFNNYHMAKLLLDHNASPNLGREPPITMAIKKRNDDIVDLLIDYGADLNRVDQKGIPPIIYAIYSPVTLRQLLTHGCKVDAVDTNGLTALLHACGQGFVEAVRILIAHGADVNYKTSDGLSIQHVSLYNINVIDELDKHGITIHRPVALDTL
jgi:ankyrin repeat protein